MPTQLVAFPDPDVTIDLGILSPFQYKLYKTNAMNKDLDYTDTISVLEYKDMRLIFIPDDPFKQTTQLQRYASAMKCAVDVTGNKTLLGMALKRVMAKVKDKQA